jgi:hypothetical protein
MSRSDFVTSWREDAADVGAGAAEEWPGVVLWLLIGATRNTATKQIESA